MKEKKKGLDAEVKILFVCMGNICRSPIAEGIFRHLVVQEGLDAHFKIDSAGTRSWHIGRSPDRRMRRVARKHGVSMDGQRARQITPIDLIRFDHIFVMDKQNRSDTLFLDLDGHFGHKVQLFRAFDPEPDDYQVPDPYYSEKEGFEMVFQIVDRTAQALLSYFIKEHNLIASSS